MKPFLGVTRALVAASALFASSLWAQNPPAAQEPPQILKADRSYVEKATPAAQQAFAKLQPLVNQQTFKELGFASLDEAKVARLGSPLRLLMIRLDRLKEYSAQTPVESILVETNEIIFPVEVGGQTRTGLKVRYANGTWRVASFGASALTRALKKTSAEVGPRANQGADSQSVVAIPALQLYFIAVAEASGIIFTPAASDPRFTFAAGRSMPAQVILADLAQYARQYKTGDRLVD